jgi:hypothetical protein
MDPIKTIFDWWRKPVKKKTLIFTAAASFGVGAVVTTYVICSNIIKPFVEGVKEAFDDIGQDDPSIRDVDEN